MAKIIFVTTSRFSLRGPSRRTVYAGTIEELVGNVFGYTLECGNSWDSKVNCHPKTAKSLISNLNKAAAASCTHYQSTYYDLSSPEEIAAYTAKNGNDMRSSCFLD